MTGLRKIGPAGLKALAALENRDGSKLQPAPAKLRRWMLDHQLTVNQLSAMTSYDRRYLDAFLRGDTRKGSIPLLAAFAIEWVTQGAVPAWLWLDSPLTEHKLRKRRLATVREMERTNKRHILKWNSLKTNDGMIREKARTLSRLFNVQWGEVKARAWHDAERAAQAERADISHLLAPEHRGPTKDGIYVTTNQDEEDDQLSDEDWFRKHTQG